MRRESALEATLARQIKLTGLPEPEREYVFCRGRRWRFDFAWPNRQIAVEVEGGVWTRGRHTRGAGFTADCEKYNYAALDGWCVYRFTRDTIVSGEAVRFLGTALEKRRTA